MAILFNRVHRELNAIKDFRLLSSSQIKLKNKCALRHKNDERYRAFNKRLHMHRLLIYLYCSNIYCFHFFLA